MDKEAPGGALECGSLLPPYRLLHAELFKDKAAASCRTPRASPPECFKYGFAWILATSAWSHRLAPPKEATNPR